MQVGRTTALEQLARPDNVWTILFNLHLERAQK
jgi:hypothetical protein